MRKMAKLARVAYRYCDAGGTKYHGDFIARGSLRLRQLEPYLISQEFFVPEQVGLQHLLTDPWSKEDHVLHTLIDFEPCESGTPVCTARQMIQRFKLASRDWLDGYT